VSATVMRRRLLLLLLLLRLQVVVIGDVDARHGLASTALLLARLERRVKQQVVGRHLLIVGCRRFTALVHLLHRSTAHTHAHAISHTKIPENFESKQTSLAFQCRSMA